MSQLPHTLVSVDEHKFGRFGLPDRRRARLSFEEQVRHSDVESDRESVDVVKPHVPLATLDPADVVPMQPSKIGEVLLG